MKSRNFGKEEYWENGKLRIPIAVRKGWNTGPERDAGAIQVEKLAQNILRVTMTEQTAFTVDSAEIKPRFHSTMDKIATVLNRYGKTELTIVGHTDSTGSAQHNQQLSERRAQAVHEYFQQKGGSRSASRPRARAKARRAPATPPPRAASSIPPRGNLHRADRGRTAGVTERGPRSS